MSARCGHQDRLRGRRAAAPLFRAAGVQKPGPALARVLPSTAPPAGLTMTLHVVGVRHHSPACARLVEKTIVRLRPRFVLIEGPSDMNDRLDEFFLAHELPVALFTY